MRAMPAASPSDQAQAMRRPAMRATTSAKFDRLDQLDQASDQLDQLDQASDQLDQPCDASKQR